MFHALVLLLLSLILCARPLYAANCAWLSEKSGIYYDLSPAYSGEDLIVPSDNSGNAYVFAPCHDTAKCNSTSGPGNPIPSPWCQQDGIYGSLNGCGQLQTAVWTESSPPGTGFSIFYIDGNPTIFNGPRTFNLTCVCSSIAPGKILLPAGSNLYEVSTAHYACQFQSRFCCPVY